MVSGTHHLLARCRRHGRGGGSSGGFSGILCVRDSLVDNGNNNYLITTARADSPPRRQAIGGETTLPYLSTELRGPKLLVGANFASAGIGILNDTGIQFANIIRMYKQLEWFEEYQRRVSSLIGQQQTQVLVNKALVLVTVGGNDFVNNYFLTPITIRRLQYNLQDYSQLLISEFRMILQRLYSLGARRVLVTGTGPLGCTPAEIALRSPNGQCADEVQRAASIFNPLLINMIADLNKELGSDVFVAVNALERQYDFINNPTAFGFVTSKVACCGQGPYNGLGLCTAASNICENRSQYAFWDPFHPSERANRIIVQTIMSGSEKYMAPMNLSTIMELDSRA
ncbi:hypothetical protein DH2020_001232 [Rehmannia glutinosa]|uniref:GDSL esterase/lipase n=1 Tax=Rehmannia glutinosa TaxID=99300 RepID=A0ABR0XZ65_REHGL